MPIYPPMNGEHSVATMAENEISLAALSAYGRLLRAAGARLRTHVARDGGLICEDTSVRARPTMWRISRDGTIVPDSPYSFRLRAFITARLPHGV